MQTNASVARELWTTSGWFGTLAFIVVINVYIDSASDTIHIDYMRAMQQGL